MEDSNVLYNIRVSRRITTINRWFVRNGYDIDQIWARIDVCVYGFLVAYFESKKYLELDHPFHVGSRKPEDHAMLSHPQFPQFSIWKFYFAI